MEPIKAYISKFAQSVIRLFDIDEGSTARFNEQKQGLLDLMDSMERSAIAYNTQLAEEGKVLTFQGVVVVRPDLAFPELYEGSFPQPLETRISNTNGLYQ